MEEKGLLTGRLMLKHAASAPSTFAHFLEQEESRQEVKCDNCTQIFTSKQGLIQTVESLKGLSGKICPGEVPRVIMGPMGLSGETVGLDLHKSDSVKSKLQGLKNVL